MISLFGGNKKLVDRLWKSCVVEVPIAISGIYQSAQLCLREEYEEQMTDFVGG